MALAIYGVDIGVYRTNRLGAPSATTTLAWAKFDQDTYEEEISLRNQHGAFVTGKDLLQFADLLRMGLESKKAVAIGFEAPMWIPAPLDLPAGRTLFAPRFAEESGTEWYLQSEV